MRSLPLIFLLALACSETGISAFDDVVEPGEDDPDETVPDDEVDPEPELCDLPTAPGGEVGIDESCSSPQVLIEDPWNVAIEWQYTVRSGAGSYVMPVVGNLTDDNGDGVIDTLDNPDIVLSSLNNTVVAMHGDGSGEIWVANGMNGYGGVTLADVDHDGRPEVIGWTNTNQVIALNADGTEKWRSPTITGNQMYPQPAVGDLTGDGRVEIVMDRAVVAGADGALLAMLPDPGVSWRAPVIADLDADGVGEILLGRHAYRPDGTIKWSVPQSPSGDSCFAAVGDIDGDIGGESFWVWGPRMYVVDDDGTLIRTVTLPTNPNRPGPPAIADFDGDGEIEIVVPMNREIGMFEADGTLRWTQRMQDNSGIAGVSGYDVDGDGAFEAIFADEVAMRIYDGTTGTVRYENFSHSSGTVWEYPVIADVDNDGSAEIVIASQGSTWRGVTVFGHAGGGWAEAGPVWPTHDFAVTNIRNDLSVPSPLPLPWTTHNVFRARPAVDNWGVDLKAQITEVCAYGCTPNDLVQVSAQPYNVGFVEVEAGVRMTLYARDGEDLTLIETWTIPDPIPGGAMLPSYVYTFHGDQIGADGVVVRIDDDGFGASTVYECVEDNNDDAWLEFDCE